MCYSPEVSFGTFFFVVAVAGYLWQRNHPLDRAIALIFGTVVLMQLLEGLLWIFLNGPEPVLERLTNLVPAVLLFQPILFMYIHWQYKSGWGVGYRELFFLFLAASPFALASIYSELKGEMVRQDESGHLAWPLRAHTFTPWVNALYWFGIVYGFGTLKNIPLSLLLVGGSTLSYLKFRTTSSESWPSLWCHFVNFLAPLAVLLN